MAKRKTGVRPPIIAAGVGRATGVGHAVGVGKSLVFEEFNEAETLTRLREIEDAIRTIQAAPGNPRNRSEDIGAILHEIEAARDMLRRRHFELAHARYRGIEKHFAAVNTRQTEKEVLRSRRAADGGARGRDSRSADREKKWKQWVDEVQRLVAAGSKLTAAYAKVAEDSTAKGEKVSDAVVARAYRKLKKT